MAYGLDIGTQPLDELGECRFALRTSIPVSMFSCGFLSSGWPILIGVIEALCRNVEKFSIATAILNEARSFQVLNDAFVFRRVASSRWWTDFAHTGADHDTL